MVESMDDLRLLLEQMQKRQEVSLVCELSPALSARINDAALKETLVTGLPAAQGIAHRILHSRGRGTVISAKVRYRQGVRMLAGNDLTSIEAEGLMIAQNIANRAMQLGEAKRFGYIYDWTCRNICYVHTAPGKKGYEKLVGAADVLLAGQANCQGFADVLYLLCGLCGIPCQYRCGRGMRQLHVWNNVRLNGKWQDADASKGARAPENETETYS